MHCWCQPSFFCSNILNPNLFLVILSLLQSELQLGCCKYCERKEYQGSSQSSIDFDDANVIKEMVGNSGVKSKLVSELVGERKLEEKVLQIVETQMWQQLL